VVLHKVLPPALAIPDFFHQPFYNIAAKVRLGCYDAFRVRVGPRRLTLFQLGSYRISLEHLPIVVLLAYLLGKAFI